MMLSLDKIAFIIFAATFAFVLLDIISSYSNSISLVIHNMYSPRKKDINTLWYGLLLGIDIKRQLVSKTIL